MKSFAKALITGVLFSLTMASCVYAEEANTQEAASVPVAEGVAAIPQAPAAPVEKTTLDNLQAAFNGESNANARYLAFAKQAEAEGYGKVASLFRAAARAEQVHFEWHAKLIKGLGAVPTANIEAPVVKTTTENLQAAMEGEIYENTVMYPEFLAKAEADGNKDAADAFEDAEKAEGVHAALYKDALANLKKWKGKKSDFYVCPVCGNVVERVNFKSCPICGESKRRFMTVS